MEALCRYNWPGNVRELENSVERAIALAGNATFLKREHLLRTPSGGDAFPLPADADVRTLEAVVEEAERIHIRRVLRSTQGQKARAAKVLGISRKNLWEKMKQYGLEPLSDEPEE
jgi:two-component system response regulator AtoC